VPGNTRFLSQIARPNPRSRIYAWRVTVGIGLVSSAAIAGEFCVALTFPPDMLRNPRPVLKFRQCDDSCRRRYRTRADLTLRHPSRTCRPV